MIKGHLQLWAFAQAVPPGQNALSHPFARLVVFQDSAQKQTVALNERDKPTPQNKS